jgi:NADPH-dependent curcumin reductase CurA
MVISMNLWISVLGMTWYFVICLCNFMSSNQEKLQSSVVVVAAAAADVGAVVFLLPLLILDTVVVANRFLKKSRTCRPLSSLCVPLESGHYSAGS